MEFSLGITSQNWPRPSLNSLKIASTLAVLLLAGCSNALPPTTVQVAPVQIDLPDLTPNLPNPTPVRILDVDWKVITPETLPVGEWVYFALTPEDYEDLATNNAELLRYLKETGWLLRYYRGELPEPTPSISN